MVGEGSGLNLALQKKQSITSMWLFNLLNYQYFEWFNYYCLTTENQIKFIVLFTFVLCVGYFMNFLSYIYISMFCEFLQKIQSKFRNKYCLLIT